jgi:uncharacterized membrane protein YgcG
VHILGYMFLDDVDYLVEDVVISKLPVLCAHLHIISSKHSTVIRCIIRMFAYALASYKIAGGVAGSSTGGAGLDGSAGAQGTGGARGRRTRRGATRVRRPPS